MKKHAYFLVLVLFSFLLFEIFFVLVLFLFAKSNKMFAKSNEKNSVFELEIFSVLVLFLFSILKVFRVLVLFLFENKNMFANMFPNNMRVLSSLATGTTDVTPQSYTEQYGFGQRFGRRHRNDYTRSWMETTDEPTRQPDVDGVLCSTWYCDSSRWMSRDSPAGTGDHERFE